MDGGCNLKPEIQLHYYKRTLNVPSEGEDLNTGLQECEMEAPLDQVFASKK